MGATFIASSQCADYVLREEAEVGGSRYGKVFGGVGDESMMRH